MRTSGSAAAAAAAAAAGSKRSRPGLLLRKPLVMGTYAFRLSQALHCASSASLASLVLALLLGEKRRHNDMTHKWTCLLRSPEGEDISYFIKKVVFELDPSFVNPRRTLTAPPYEVSEAGWGEFCLTARIFLVDESLPPVEMSHFLRLNLPGASQSPCVASETESIALMQEAFLLTLQIQELQRQHEAITTGAAAAAAAATAATPAALPVVQGDGAEGAAGVAVTPGLIDPSAATPLRQAGQNMAFPMGSSPGPSTQMSAAGARSLPLANSGPYESPKSPQFSVGADPQQQQHQQQQQQQGKGMMLPQPHPSAGIPAQQQQHLLQQQHQQMMQQQQLLQQQQHQQLMQQQQQRQLMQQQQHYMPKLQPQNILPGGHPQQQQQQVLQQPQIGQMPVGPGPI
ncbi:hypothetical protein Emed_000712 [Eimeria media]